MRCGWLLSVSNVNCQFPVKHVIKFVQQISPDMPAVYCYRSGTTAGPFTLAVVANTAAAAAAVDAVTSVIK